MEPTWISSLMNRLTVLLVTAIPVALIALGIWLGLRLMRENRSTANLARPVDRSGRALAAISAFVVGVLLLILLFTMAVRPGESPLLVVLPNLLVILAYIGFWVLVIAGGVWLVPWIALRMGVVGLPVRETPLDILKARYARGEITKAQYQELKGDLTEPQS